MSHNRVPFPGLRLFHEQEDPEDHNHTLSSLWSFGNNSKYTWEDVDNMGFALALFFTDHKGNLLREALRSAEETYMETLKQPGVSPLKAFQDVVMTTPLALEMDKLYANHGGIVYYLTNNWPVAFSRSRRKLSPAMWADCQKARSSRKMEEIKKLMATGNLEENVGDLVTEERQTTVADGPGLGTEACQSGGDEEMKEDGIDEATAEMALDEARRVLNSLDSQAPLSG